MANVGIALGSNIGLRLSHLREARDLLTELMPRNAKVLQAPIYQSTPVDCQDNSPDFYNTVLEIIYEGSPSQLLSKTQQIEKQLGRPEKMILNEPRIIDIDILYFDDIVIESNYLSIPHSRITERRFVLEPLAEINPELILPNEVLTISELLENLHTDEPALSMVQSHW